MKKFGSCLKIIIFLWFSVSPLQAKSHDIFRIKYKETLTPSNDDYAVLQNKLRHLHPASALNKLYVARAGRCPKEDFIRRIETGKNLVLVDPARSLYPHIILQKIGTGGSNCVVTYASFNRAYHEYAHEIASNLEQCHFQGWYLGIIGGYPNPTGRELRYAGYPYAWKIFAILEAFNRGFENVLWIDCPLKPLKDPRWLFDQIAANGAFFLGKFQPGPVYGYLPKVSRALTRHFKYTPYDRHIFATVMGLNRWHPATKKLVKSYYKALRYDKGKLFIGVGPEESVLSSLIPYAGFGEKVYSEALGLPLRGGIFSNAEQSLPGGPFFEYRAH